MNHKVMVVGSEKASSDGRRKPRIRFAGYWLNDMGFSPDSLVMATYNQEVIDLKVVGYGPDAYKSIVKQVRTNRAALLQVREEIHNKKKTPHLEVKGVWLENLGFKIGSLIVTRIDYGHIQIGLINLDKLGFLEASYA